MITLFSVISVIFYTIYLDIIHGKKSISLTRNYFELHFSLSARLRREDFINKFKGTEGRLKQRNTNPRKIDFDQGSDHSKPSKVTPTHSLNHSEANISHKTENNEQSTSEHIANHMTQKVPEGKKNLPRRVSTSSSKHILKEKSSETSFGFGSRTSKKTGNDEKIGENLKIITSRSPVTFSRSTTVKLLNIQRNRELESLSKALPEQNTPPNQSLTNSKRLLSKQNSSFFRKDKPGGTKADREFIFLISKRNSKNKNDSSRMISGTSVATDRSTIFQMKNMRSSASNMSLSLNKIVGSKGVDGAREDQKRTERRLTKPVEAACVIPKLNPFHKLAMQQMKDLGVLDCSKKTFSAMKSGYLEIKGKNVYNAFIRYIKRDGEFGAEFYQQRQLTEHPKTTINEGTYNLS